MKESILIFVGAGGGGVARFWLSSLIYHYWEHEFPIGTLIVNITGAFLIGFFISLFLDRFPNLSAEIRAFLIIGFLGGYTTFSAVSYETVVLYENGSYFNCIFSCLLDWVGIYSVNLMC